MSRFVFLSLILFEERLILLSFCSYPFALFWYIWSEQVLHFSLLLILVRVKVSLFLLMWFRNGVLIRKYTFTDTFLLKNLKFPALILFFFLTKSKKFWFFFPCCLISWFRCFVDELHCSLMISWFSIWTNSSLFGDSLSLLCLKVILVWYLWRLFSPGGFSIYCYKTRKSWRSRFCFCWTFSSIVLMIPSKLSRKYCFKSKQFWLYMYLQCGIVCFSFVGENLT